MAMTTKKDVELIYSDHLKIVKNKRKLAAAAAAAAEEGTGSKPKSLLLARQGGEPPPVESLLISKHGKSKDTLLKPIKERRNQGKHSSLFFCRNL